MLEVNCTRQTEFPKVWVSENVHLQNKGTSRKSVSWLLKRCLISFWCLCIRICFKFISYVQKRDFQNYVTSVQTNSIPLCVLSGYVMALIAITSLHGPYQPHLGLPPACPAALFKLSAEPSLFVWVLLEEHWFLVAVMVGLDQSCQTVFHRGLYLLLLLYFYSPKITFLPFKAIVRLMWPPVKMNLTPLCQSHLRHLVGSAIALCLPVCRQLKWYVNVCLCIILKTWGKK